MAEFYEILEISKNGAPTGKYRRTVRSDDPICQPKGLCSHEHDSIEEAANCPEGLQNIPRFMRPKSSEELLLVRLKRIIQQYKLQQPESKIEIVILTKEKNDPKIVQNKIGDDLGGV